MNESLAINVQKSRVVVAMSGGVDSSVAALLLKRQGYDVVGVAMQVWDYRQNGGSAKKASCCSPSDFCDARSVASLVDIPFYVLDFEESFRERVINKFVESYQRGETPNPCVDCNNNVKFRELRDRARTFTCGVVATGHYARISEDSEGRHLLRGVDQNKDQSYFLYGMRPQELGETFFPVGDLTKEQVRELAREAGLSTAQKPESQDICFVSGSVSDFVTKIGVKRKPGKIVDSLGRVLGEHDGIEAFTVGQRRGIGVGGSDQPLYVTEIDAANNCVVVGGRQALENFGFTVRNTSWLSPSIIRKLEANEAVEVDCLVQVRHRHRGVAVRLLIETPDRAEVRFKNEWTAISPGQAAVFYDLTNTEVLGGGPIEKALNKV